MNDSQKRMQRKTICFSQNWFTKLPLHKMRHHIIGPMHHQYHVMVANVSSIHELNMSQIHRDIYKRVAFEIATPKNGKIISKFKSNKNESYYYMNYLHDVPPHYCEDSLNQPQFRCSPGHRWIFVKT